MERSSSSSPDFLQSTTLQVRAIAPPEVREPLLKRALDVILSVTRLIASAPVSLLIALAIKLEDGGPIFCCQERWGRGVTRFRVYKFRSMCLNSTPCRMSIGAARVRVCARHCPFESVLSDACGTPRHRFSTAEY